ncbi:MAG: DotU family type IV/VI secretion system protein [Alphaproteobacteria bacterium]|nr:DotU family type IV/VI secretion system protein [Alphaproteobacteria bacterium]
MSALENICRPILISMCNYWQLIENNQSVDKDTFKKEIRSLISEARETANKSPSLEREFSRVEKPLIFFVDYMVKEGNFPFKNEWREIGREYNELSGDEKFFDMLTETLDDPDSANSLEIFYNVMGLGFSGIYQNDPEYLERRMKVCASRFDTNSLDLTKEEIIKVDETILDKKVIPNEKQMFKVRNLVFFCLFVMLVTFGVNLWKFLSVTYEYRDALDRAVDASIPNSIIVDSRNRHRAKKQTFSNEKSSKKDKAFLEENKNRKQLKKKNRNNLEEN